MSDVPSMAVFFSGSIESFHGTVSNILLLLLLLLLKIKKHHYRSGQALRVPGD